MDRKQFFGNLVGLAAIASNLKELSTIGIDNTNLLKYKKGDILFSKKMISYYYDGIKLIPIDSEHDNISINDISSNDYIVMRSAASEYTII